MTRVRIAIGQDKPVILTCRNRAEATRRALGLVNTFRDNGRPVRGSARQGSWRITGLFDPITVSLQVVKRRV